MIIGPGVIVVVICHTGGVITSRIGGATPEVPPESQGNIVVPVYSGPVNDPVVQIDADKAVFFSQVTVMDLENW
jgi:hypothetical protein